MRVHAHLEHWAEQDPRRLCVSDGARSFSYQEMNGWADRVATALLGLGLADGDRIGVLSRNCVEWIAVYYGAFKAGVVPVPLNFRLHPREWAYLLADSAASAVLAQSEYVGALESIRADLPSALIHLGGSAGGSAGGDQGGAGDPPDGWLDFRSLVDDAQPAAVARPSIAEDHDLWQMYTSGTTGRPKGAVLTHAAVEGNVAQLHAAIPIGAGDRMLAVMPLFHVAATILVMLPITAGAAIRIVNDFDPRTCAAIIDEAQVTCAPLAPAMLQAMLVHDAGLRARRYAHLRTLMYGASPISEATLRQAMGVFDCDFLQGYGQTESSGALTILDPAAHRRALAGDTHLLLSCGRPMQHSEIEVVDSDGKPVPTGEVGEIVARGPQLMRGYWNRPADTAAALADGWLHTGDAGRLDAEGYLYICDRVKDMIVSGAENIYPREIEDVIAAIPEVAEVAVIGVPDDRWGEVPKAMVVLRPGTALAEAAVIDCCRAHLAGYKTPRTVDFVEALPRTATGKVQKTVLREPYWQGRNRRVG